MRSVCFFASHYAGGSVPLYIKVYLTELSTHFDKVLFLCENEPDRDSSEFLNHHSIEWLVVLNRGYDFGKWLAGFKKIDVSSCQMVGLANDSCVLFASLHPFFDWLKQENAEVTGMTKSASRGEHIQSYFMVLRGRAVAVAQNHFAETGVVTDYNEVITRYELALSSRFLNHGLKLAGFVDNDGYKGEFSPYYKCVASHIKQGMPMIKKRILLADYRKPELFTLARMNFKILPNRYVNLIRAVHGDRLLDPAVLELMGNNRMSFGSRVSYEATRLFIRLFRPFKRVVK